MSEHKPRDVTIEYFCDHVLKRLKSTKGLRCIVSGDRCTCDDCKKYKARALSAIDEAEGVE